MSGQPAATSARSRRVRQPPFSGIVLRPVPSSTRHLHRCRASTCSSLYLPSTTSPVHRLKRGAAADRRGTRDSRPSMSLMCIVYFKRIGGIGGGGGGPTGCGGGAITPGVGGGGGGGGGCPNRNRLRSASGSSGTLFSSWSSFSASGTCAPGSGATAPGFCAGFAAVVSFSSLSTGSAGVRAVVAGGAAVSLPGPLVVPARRRRSPAIRAIRTGGAVAGRAGASGSSGYHRRRAVRHDSTWPPPASTPACCHSA